MEAIDPRVPLTLLPEGCQADVVNGPHGEYRDLPAIATPRGQLITRWTFTEEERARIAAGEDMYLTIWSVALGDHRVITPLTAAVGVCDWRD